MTHFVERKMTGEKILDENRGGVEQLNQICYGEGGGKESLLIQNTCCQL